jgi:cell division protein FtsQ
VAGRRRTAARPPRARAAAVALPRSRLSAATRSRIGRFAPSRRSLLVGFGVVVVAIGAYLAARESSAFAITRVEVAGAPAHVRHDVHRAVGPLVGTNLLALDGATLVRRVEALPTVVSVTYDRGFPHTLRLTVVPETVVAVLHRGRETWLVSARGRVVARIPNGARRGLPRIWVTRATPVSAGAFLAEGGPAVPARALALAAGFPYRVETAGYAHGLLVFRLRTGVELRLGEPTDVRLKLAVARRALRQLPAGDTYLDVSVAGRPVAGQNPQLSSRG